MATWIYMPSAAHKLSMRETLQTFPGTKVFFQITNFTEPALILRMRECVYKIDPEFPLDQDPVQLYSEFFILDSCFLRKFCRSCMRICIRPAYVSLHRDDWQTETRPINSALVKMERTINKVPECLACSFIGSVTPES